MARSPLFDIYDPYGIISQSLPDIPGLDDNDPFAVVPVRSRRPRVEDLMPEDEQVSMLRSLANRGASGLSALGWLLDTPGSMVRGALAEGPWKGLSALWETSDERVTGRELLREYGLAGDEDNWGNFGGGLASEILLDPLTYASLGLAPLLGGVAKTAAGKAAAKAGMFGGDLGLIAKKAVDAGKRGAGYGRMQLQRETPEAFFDILSQFDPAEASRLRGQFMDVAGDQATELLGKRMSGSNRVGLPFMGDTGYDLFGEAYGDFITKAADQVGQTARGIPGLGPVLRGAEALVSGRVMGEVDEAKQWRARRASERDRLGLAAGNREVAELFTPIAQQVGFEKWQDNAWRSQFDEAFTLAMENQRGSTTWDALPEDIRNLFTPGGTGHQLVNNARAIQKEELLRSAEMGVPVDGAGLPYGIGYMSRQKVYPDSPRMPDGYLAPQERAMDQGLELFGLSGGEGARRDYTQAFPRWVLNKMARDGDFQSNLREAMRRPAGERLDDYDLQTTIDNWLRTNAPEYMQKVAEEGGDSPFSYMLRNVDDIDSDAGLAAAERMSKAYRDLADRFAGLPQNYAEEGLPFFGSGIADFSRYVTGRSRLRSNAQALYEELADMLKAGATPDVPEFSSLSVQDALKAFGLDVTQQVDEAGNVTGRSAAERQLANAMGIQGFPADNLDVLDTLRLPTDFIEEMKKRTQRARVPYEAKGLLKGIDQYTQAFKSLALLFPSRYSRDLYSGAFSSAMRGLFNPLDSYAAYKAGRGEYGPLARRLATAPGYENLTEDERILKFLTGAGGEQLTQNNVLDDMGRQASNLNAPDLFPGSTGNYTQGLRESMRRNPNPLAIFRKGPDGKWGFNPNFLFWSQRTRQGNPNWLLDAGDRAATATDATNRIGAYLAAVRKGNTPEAARDLADLTQVNYRPENFTAFEREFVKRLIPFYSFTKGIAPLVYEDIVNRPAGLMGQTIRATNRAAEPSEDRFTPEYLRQSAAIPLDGDIPFLGLDTPGVTRFLTNIDLPYEGLINLFTPGVSNTLVGQAGDAFMRTGQNLLGQTNPLLKAPLEWFTNRQFYSGRQLSDLYSMLEQSLGPAGRGIEQLLYNAPGGSRIAGVFRQIMDDRIDPSEKAAKFLFNTLTGLKLQDVDQERTVRLAARTTLNDLLDQAKGMQTYENIFIKPEDLEKLPEAEKRQYLLYRVLQSQASREARERKKREQLMDPLEMLGAF
jgi:hypothetical protein